MEGGSRAWCAGGCARLLSVIWIVFLAGFLAGGPKATAYDLTTRVVDPAKVGSWGMPIEWPHEAIHAVLLPTGKVLTFQGFFEQGVWDPQTGDFEDVRDNHESQNMWCSAHTVLADGRVLIAGGADEVGYDASHTVLFNPWIQDWEPAPRMATSRFYPTLLRLADGRVLAIAGYESYGPTVTVVEWLGEDWTWHQFDTPAPEMDVYPHLYQMRDGRVVRVLKEARSVFLDPTSGAWSDGPEAPSGQVEGSSALLPDGSGILVLGATLTDGTNANILELAPEPYWRPTAPMNVPRKNTNLLLLPDAGLLALGGDGVAGRFTERFDPHDERWEIMAPSRLQHAYHSTATLLPDGRVLLAGGEGGVLAGTGDGALVAFRAGEIYSPPYLFRGPRPVLAGAPPRLIYGASHSIATPDIGRIAHVRLMRLGSMTHALNFDQRLIELDFTINGEEILAFSPRDARDALPGWYQMFLVDSDGVPSVSRMIELRR